MYSCEFNFSWPGSCSKTPRAPVLSCCQSLVSPPAHSLHTAHSFTHRAAAPAVEERNRSHDFKHNGKSMEKTSSAISKKPTYPEHPTYIIRELVVQTLWKTGQIIYGVAWCVPLSGSQHMCTKSIFYLGFHLYIQATCMAAANTASKPKNPPKLQRLFKIPLPHMNYSFVKF